MIRTPLKDNLDVDWIWEIARSTLDNFSFPYFQKTEDDNAKANNSSRVIERFILANLFLHCLMSNFHGSSKFVLRQIAVSRSKLSLRRSNEIIFLRFLIDFHRRRMATISWTQLLVLSLVGGRHSLKWKIELRILINKLYRYSEYPTQHRCRKVSGEAIRRLLKLLRALLYVCVAKIRKKKKKENKKIG